LSGVPAIWMIAGTPRDLVGWQVLHERRTRPGHLASDRPGCHHVVPVAAGFGVRGRARREPVELKVRHRADDPRGPAVHQLVRPVTAQRLDTLGQNVYHTDVRDRMAGHRRQHDCHPHVGAGLALEERDLPHADGQRLTDR